MPPPAPELITKNISKKMNGSKESGHGEGNEREGKAGLDLNTDPKETHHKPNKYCAKTSDTYMT